MEIPPKIASGKSGKPIKLISNSFSVDAPAGEIYHYNLQIEPFREYNQERKRKIVNTMLKTNENFKNRPVAYDGGENLYTRIALDFEHELTCQIVLGVQKFNVVIKRVWRVENFGFTVKLDPIHALFSDEASSVLHEPIKVLELALRIGPLLNYFPIRNFFFYPPRNIYPAGGAVNIWTGYRQSLSLGQCQILLNINIKGNAFYAKRPLLDYFQDFLHVSQLSNNVNFTRDDIKRISSGLRGLKVTKLGRKYTIDRLTDKSAEELNMSGQNITVADYFTKQNEPLKYPYLPCLQFRQKNLICPIEVCEVVVQPVVNSVNGRHRYEIMKFTACSAKKKFENIIESLNQCNEFKETYLKAFGIKIANEPLKLEGRIIDPPKLSYQKEEAIKPKDGCWNAKNRQYFRASSVYSWIVVSFSNCEPQHLERFTKLLFDIATEHGMKMKPVKNICIVNKREPVKYILSEIFQKFKTDLIVVVLPGNDKEIYKEVKEFSETKPCLVTQCVKDTSVSEKCKPSVLSNLCQKINSRMGGINSILEPDEMSFLLQRPVIIMGASVSTLDPSFLMRGYLNTVVGNLDLHLSKYAVKHSLRNYKKNNDLNILDLKSMITDLLKAFCCNNRGKKPEKIIFFRAGVCENQFGHIKCSEVRDIRAACKALDATYSPGITYIVLQKHHQTRFVPHDSRYGVGRMGNIPPGIVVDSDVVRPSGFDFFLCSHFVTQGTSVPSRYTILEDDNRFSADELQKLTYHLCHTYAFSTKSLSCPAPIRYAQLAAHQVLKKLQFDDSEDYSKIEQLKNTMFFI